jgi:hypothetical protein
MNSDFVTNGSNEHMQVQQMSMGKNKSKRGRGKGSRGSYRPRGKIIRPTTHNSTHSSYTSQAQKVCINPEILKQLGYNNSNSNF